MATSNSCDNCGKTTYTAPNLIPVFELATTPSGMVWQPKMVKTIRMGTSGRLEEIEIQKMYPQQPITVFVTLNAGGVHISVDVCQECYEKHYKAVVEALRDVMKASLLSREVYEG